MTFMDSSKHKHYSIWIKKRKNKLPYVYSHNLILNSKFTHQKKTFQLYSQQATSDI